MEEAVGFDWWRCGEGGRIIKRRIYPQQQHPPHHHQPQQHYPDHLQPNYTHPNDRLCWPMLRGPSDDDQVEPKTAEDVHLNCQIGRDFWPDRGDRSTLNRDAVVKGYRPPWSPAKIPCDCGGVVKFPPPYGRYCRDRDKFIPYACRY